MSGAAHMTAPPQSAGLAANARAFLAFRQAASSLRHVLRLNVVAGVAGRLVVVSIHRLLRVPRAFLRHLSPPSRRAAYSGSGAV